jgi:fatty-acyl-CoA synthase
LAPTGPPDGTDRIAGLPHTIPEALHKQCDQQPDAEALVYGSRRLSWREIDAWSSRVARGLYAIGVRPGDRIGLFLPNCLEWIAAFYAIAKLGAAAVPIHLRYKGPEIAHVLGNTDVRFLICTVRNEDRDYTDTLTTARESSNVAMTIVIDALNTGCLPRAIAWSDIERAGLKGSHAELEAVAARIDPKDLLIIQYTSGTTGLPKGVELRHQQLIRAASGLGSRMGMGVGDRFFSPMPFFHIGGTAASLLAALVSGSMLCFSGRFNPRDALKIITTERCTHVCGVESMMVDILSQPDFLAFDLSSLRSGWTNRNIRVFETFPGMINVYALSECSSAVAMCEWDDEVIRRRDTCGLPLDGLELRIGGLTSDESVPNGTSGRILVRGWCVTSGYFGNLPATAAALQPDGWFDTGDFGHLNAEHSLVYEGRLKDVLRVGGENVGSLEIEAVLNAHPSVLRSAVVPLPDARLQQIPCALVQLGTDSSATAEDLIAFCAVRLARFKVPRHVLFVEGFEMTETNKIIKQALTDYAMKAIASAAGQ